MEITKEEKGYEIPFTRHFYVYQPIRQALEAINERGSLKRKNTLLMNESGIIL
jgi:hypothetical protein